MVGGGEELRCRGSRRCQRVADAEGGWSRSKAARRVGGGVARRHGGVSAFVRGDPAASQDDGVGELRVERTAAGCGGLEAGARRRLEARRLNCCDANEEGLARGEARERREGTRGHGRGERRRERETRTLRCTRETRGSRESHAREREREREHARRRRGAGCAPYIRAHERSRRGERVE